MDEIGWDFNDHHTISFPASTQQHAQQRTSSTMLSEAAECLESEGWDRLYTWLEATLSVSPTADQSSTSTDNNGTVAGADEELQNRNIRLCGTILIESCSKASVPLKLFQLIVDKTGSNQALLYQDDAFRTPLHAVIAQLPRPDLCQFLVDEGGSSALESRDHGGLRPIEVNTQRILMLIERLRYLQKRAAAGTVQAKQQKEQIDLETKRLQDFWECARILCLGHSVGNKYHHRSLPLLHAVYLSRLSVPVEALVHRALMAAKERHQQELKKMLKEDGDRVEKVAHPLMERDSVFGNTPLHVFAATYAHQGQAYNHEEDDEEDDEDEELLKELLRLAPGASALMNNAKLYPLDLAIAAGRRWSSGCKMLLQAYPPALIPHQIIGQLPSTSSTKNHSALHENNNIAVSPRPPERGKWLVFCMMKEEQARQQRVQQNDGTIGAPHGNELCNIVFQLLRARPQILGD